MICGVKWWCCSLQQVGVQSAGLEMPHPEKDIWEKYKDKGVRLIELTGTSLWRRTAIPKDVGTTYP